MEDRLIAGSYFQAFLEEVQLAKPLTHLGWSLARQTVDILGDLPLDDFFFGQTPVKIEEFEEIKALVSRLEDSRLHDFPDSDRLKLLELALRFTPGIHNMASLPEMLEELILEGRLAFRERISTDHPGALTFYKMSEYIFSQTILSNILFGKPRTDRPNAQDRISQSVIHLLIQEELLERIVEIGMNFVVGTKGDRLSGGQRQKLAIARVFLKKPPILIMDEATSGLDNASQQRIQMLLETKWKGKSTVISVVHRLDTIKGYDKVAVMKSGQIIEMGGYEELIEKKGVLYGLVHGAKQEPQ
jgi:ABC-type branched-subunit amino acid transport system ATPase component